jgi:hypothetical protein
MRAFKIDASLRTTILPAVASSPTLARDYAGKRAMMGTEMRRQIVTT